MKLSGPFITGNTEAQMWGSEPLGNVRYLTRQNAFELPYIIGVIWENYVHVESCFSGFHYT